MRRLISVALSLSVLGIHPRAATAEPVGEPAHPGVFSGDARALPTVPPWTTATPRREGPPRRNTAPEGYVPPAPIEQKRRDPLLQHEAYTRSNRPRIYSPPELDFAGGVDTGYTPPDTVGDIGSSHYIQAVNGASSIIRIYNKSGTLLAGPINMSSLWTAGGACVSGGGDGIVLYDPLASRWLLAEFASTGNHLCIYLSRNDDPVAGGWLNYDFETPEFPDYPKVAVWSTGYYVTTNESQPTVYALDRTKMLAGLPAAMQRFTAPLLAGFGFQSLTPADLDGTSAPPGGSPAFFARHDDDELNDPFAADPVHDFVEIWQLDIDFNTPANSSFALATSLPVAEFNSNLCGTSSSCVPQPGTAQKLDPIREVIMWRLQYRNFGAYQTLIGNFTVDVNGANHHGIRWFELRRTGLGAWSLYQEGTYAPDAVHRWLGAIAMDGSGNMALGFSVSDAASVFPGMRYSGRLASDGLGSMTQAEVTVMAGAASKPSDPRWGDYAAMSVDPIDDCTYWFTSEHVPSPDIWATRIARFRYDAPTCVSASAPPCGNNVKEVGEDCDGTDDAFCPGLCSGSCTCPAPSCGNDAVEVGEECDGTSAAACSTGLCNADCTCNLCGSTPAALCRTAEAARASVQIKDDPIDSKDKVTWSWKKGDLTLKDDFGNPTQFRGPHYQVCVYDNSPASQPLMNALVTAGGTCGTKACWKESSKGYRYTNRDGNSNGISGLSLVAGDQGRAAIKVQGKGVALDTPHPTLTLPVTVQLVADTGYNQTCWQTQYSTAAKNDTTQFKAKGP